MVCKHASNHIAVQKEKDYQTEFSDERIKKEIDRFLTGFSNRFIPIEVPTIEGKTVRLRFKGYNMTAEDYAKSNVSDAVVLIHDGVRPLITEQTITDNINKVGECGSCITCVPATETFVVTKEDGQMEIPSRANSLIARAPQSFHLCDILSAHRKAIQQGRHDFIDSCTMMRHYGYRLGTVIGPMENIKITTPTDFFVLRAMVKVHEDQQIFGF